jgi:hypothetical protein
VVLVLLLDNDTGEKLGEYPTERPAAMYAKFHAQLGRSVVLSVEGDPSQDRLYQPERSDAKAGGYAYLRRCPTCKKFRRWPKAKQCNECRQTERAANAAAKRVA